MKNLLLHPTPIGTVGIVENGRAITDILFEEQLPGHAVRHTTLLLERAAKQLDEYFAGKRTSFDLPLEPEGTPYRKKIWQVLTEIPYGQTMTYGEIARRTGNPQASRAVGGANHHNPIPIVNSLSSGHRCGRQANRLRRRSAAQRVSCSPSKGTGCRNKKRRPEFFTPAFFTSSAPHHAGSNISLPTPQSGQLQSSGRSSKAVPGAMPLSGSPTAGS